MAFQLAITKSLPFQTTPLSYPNGYWVATFAQLDKTNSIATVVFKGYADKTTRNAGTAQPVNTHTITVRGAAFNSYFSDAAISGGSNAYAQAYLMAKAVADPAGIGQNAAPATIFFANASNV